MAARLVMRARAVHAAIILRDMEINCPRTKRGDELVVGFVELLRRVLLRKQRVLGRIHTEEIQVGVR